MNFYQIAALPEKMLLPGITLRSVHLEKLMVTFVQLADGAVLPRHAHPHEQITIVISGSLEFILGEEKKLLRQGDVVTVPANLEHEAVTIGGPCKVYDAWSPVREDYIIT
jgi:quercetin dioxygenase-like cupin family protein